MSIKLADENILVATCLTFSFKLIDKINEIFNIGFKLNRFQKDCSRKYS